MRFYKPADLPLREFQRIAEGGCWGRIGHTADSGMFGTAGRMTRQKFSERSHLTEDRMEKSALATKHGGDGEADLRELQLNQEAQARYMSFLSHDLRGSLNGLVLMVEVLKREIEGKAASTDEVLADLAMMKRALVDTVSTMERHVLADRLRRGVLDLKYQ